MVGTVVWYQPSEEMERDMYLMYVDECGDSGLSPGSSDYFILSGMVIHEAYWMSTLRAYTEMRNRLQQKYGFQTTRELHAGEMIGRASKKYSDVKRSDRLLMFRDVLSFEASLDYARIINVVVDKRDKSFGFDPFSTAWDTLINRFENTIEYGNFPSPYDGTYASIQETGLIIVDETDEVKLRNLVRKMRHSNHIPSSVYPGMTIQHNLKFVIEDPLHKKSEWSPLIQLCDANSYFLRQSIEPNSTVKKHGAKNYFYKLEPILLKKACTKNRFGIVWR